MDLQRAAYAAVTKQLALLDKIEKKRFPEGTVQAALVAMNAHTGEIVAMVGGRDYAKSQRSEEHTSELQSRQDLGCRLLLEKTKMTGRLQLSILYTADESFMMPLH